VRFFSWILLEMKDERFKIFVEQLRDGHIEKLVEQFPADILGVKEKDLAFVDPIGIKGEAYLADDMLVLHLDVHTFATIPCLICNEPVKVEIAIKGFYHAIPIEEIKGSVYNFQEILRETVLLETPALAECNEGKCSQRQSVQKYLRKEGSTKNNERNEEGYRPFADLDFDPKKK
jgi:uncharacterized metal-binding protein YceD (DUF177 family)